MEEKKYKTKMKQGYSVPVEYGDHPLNYGTLGLGAYVGGYGLEQMMKSVKKNKYAVAVEKTFCVKNTSPLGVNAPDSIELNGIKIKVVDAVSPIDAINQALDQCPNFDETDSLHQIIIWLNKIGIKVSLPIEIANNQLYEGFEEAYKMVTDLQKQIKEKDKIIEDLSQTFNGENE
jgi:hypothetical protein